MFFFLQITAKFESKHSSSIDSIDASPNLEHHRRSKSILKNKTDVSRVLADPESERLLADNMSGSGVSDNGTVMVNIRNNLKYGNCTFWCYLSKIFKILLLSLIRLFFF